MPNVERILVVDDSATQAEAASGLLRAAGFAVDIARSGEEALERVRREHFQLVLSDIVMPGMSGHDLCHAIRTDAGVEHRPLVVLVTSLSDPREMMRGLESGADNFITKPYDPQRLVQRIRQVLAHRVQVDENAHVPVEFMGEAFRSPADPARVLGLLLSSFEELIHTAHALEHLRRRAEDASRARDEVLATVSHDLRNPIGTIFTSASLLLELPLEEELRTKQIEIIRRTAPRMDRLIVDLLEVSRIEGGGRMLETRPEGAESLVREAVEQFTPVSVTGHITLRPVIEGTLGAVWADRDRVQRVFSNLIGNAIKYTPAGGRITVSAAPDADAVRFSVADTGPGIAADDVPHIFDRYWQARRTNTAGAVWDLPLRKASSKRTAAASGWNQDPPAPCSRSRCHWQGRRARAVNRSSRVSSRIAFVTYLAFFTACGGTLEQAGVAEPRAAASDPHICRVVEAARRLPAEIRETSGLARSTHNGSRFWTINDSGNTPELFALNERGQIVQRVRVSGAT